MEDPELSLQKSKETLEESATYGRLPFDLFLSEKMDGDGSKMLYQSGQNDDEMIALAESDGCWREVSLAELRVQVSLFLLDREAIQSGWIKILWLGEHGDVVWDNRLDPFATNPGLLRGALLSATSLAELAVEATRGALIAR